MRIVITLSSSLILLGGLLAWPWTAAASQEAVHTPTAPPPPMASATPFPPTKTPLQPSHPTHTLSPASPPGGGNAKTPTPVETIPLTSTVTPTITTTATLTATLTPTLTPTPFLNLHIVVYLDSNDDGLFEVGEGVNDLVLLIHAGSWKEPVILQDGETWLAIPPDLPLGSEVQVQSPYLHWSDLLRLPKPGGILETSLRLDLPGYPVSLP